MSSTRMILSLDGGGVRESFTAALLQKLESKLSKPLHQVFDMVVGVSAGAALAAHISLGRSVDPSVLNTKRVFSKKNDGSCLLQTCFDGSGKKAELKRIFKDTKMSDLILPTAILTTRMRDGEAVTFTDSDSKQLVCDVVGASTAAPVYFPAIQINDDYYMDGGVVSNDPVFIAIQYAEKLWGQDQKLCVVSIGTGMSDDIDLKDIHPQDFGFLKWVSNNLLTMMTSSRTNYNKYIITRTVGQGNYLRINNPITVSMDDVSDSKTYELIKAGEQVWDEHKGTIIEFIFKHMFHKF